MQTKGHLSRIDYRLLEAVQGQVNNQGRYLVAVSGGIDSVVLLDLMLRIVPVEHLAVVHVNHRLRGSAADLDQQFVANLADQLGVKYYSQVCGPPPQTGFEAWGREQRYSFFKEVLSTLPDYTLLTAHTADDQVETLLIKLIQKRDLNFIEQSDASRRLQRPLLRVFKQQLVDYLTRQKLAYRADISNLDPKFLRNRVRLSLIPEFRRVAEYDCAESLLTQAGKIQQDQDCLHELAAQSAQQLKISEAKTEGLVTLEICPENFNSLPKALQWRTVQYLLDEALGYRLDYQSASAISCLLITGGGKIELIGETFVSYQNKQLIVEISRRT